MTDNAITQEMMVKDTKDEVKVVEVEVDEITREDVVHVFEIPNSTVGRMVHAPTLANSVTTLLKDIRSKTRLQIK